MSVRIENHCCDCAAPGYPCRGSACPLRHVPVHYCDKCGKEIDTIYGKDGEELCSSCHEESQEELEDEE